MWREGKMRGRGGLPARWLQVQLEGGASESPSLTPGWTRSPAAAGVGLSRGRLHGQDRTGGALCSWPEGRHISREGGPRGHFAQTCHVAVAHETHWGHALPGQAGPPDVPLGGRGAFM